MQLLIEVNQDYLQLLARRARDKSIDLLWGATRARFEAQNCR